jgi:hypothetical protein
VLDDRHWLEDQLGAGRSVAKVAAGIGCSETTLRRALRRLGLESDQRAGGHGGEPEPVRQFVGLGDRLELVDLDAEVAADELARRLAEGLTDFAELVRLAGELPRERLWGLVVESVDAATARSCAFTAAVLAAEQTRACGHSMYQRSKLNRKASDGRLKSVGSEHARRRPVDGSGGGPDGDKVAAEVSADVEDRPVLDLMTPIEKGRVTDREGRHVTVRAGRFWPPRA